MMDFRPLWAAGRAVFADAEFADGERNVVKEDEHPLRRDLIKCAAASMAMPEAFIKVSGFMSRRRWPSKSACAVSALKR